MSSIQDTHIEGDPAAITALAIFLRFTLTPAVSGLAQDFATAHRNSLDAWDGSAANAFRERVANAKSAAQGFEEEVPTIAKALEELAQALEDAQRDMADALAHAANSGLRVTGTQIHRPVPPHLSATTSADHSERLVAMHANRVAAWDWCVDTAISALESWTAALRVLEERSVRFSGSVVTLLSGLLTDVAGDIAPGLLAAHLQKLRNFHFENALRLEGHFSALTRGGVAHATPEHLYSLLDEAKAERAIGSAKGPTSASGARAISRLGRGIQGVGVLATGYGIYDDIHHGGESVEQAVVSNVGGAAAGAITGVVAGAVVGSFIVPPVGTVVGAGVGAIVGAGVGMFTSGAIDHLYENVSAGFSSTVDAGWNEITDTLSDVGDLASNAWNSLFG